MAATDADGEPLTAMVIPLTWRSERAQAAVFAGLLRREIASMKRKVSKADAAWERRCASDGYIDPSKRLVMVRERLIEASRMLSALNVRFPRNRVG
jgi:hypothetical protein